MPVVERAPTSLRCLLLAALMSAACGSAPQPVAPSPPVSSLEGSWYGTATTLAPPAYFGTQTINATILHSGTVLTGTWASYNANGGLASSGFLSGNVIASSVTFTLTPGDSTMCAYKITGNSIGDTTISGTFTTDPKQCTVVLTGNFFMTK